MIPNLWPAVPITFDNFRSPPREYGILPFWFLNGELNPEEMRYQLREFHEKGMPGIILHGRYGLETLYIGETYLERIRFAVEEAEKLGLKTWIYDEMNWPSGTADKRVLQARPDLAERYIECINFTVRGPWFTYLTGADSRYLDFEKSTPVAAFAVRLDSGAEEVIDLTPNLSFRDVIPWEAPAGNWRLIYIVEKVADYYIDALNPESTAEFLRLGYDPYARAVKGKLASQMLGFYTDEPAMHYYLSGGDNPVVPWTKDMFRRFQERNGYNLRPRLPDLFFDIHPASARVRYDFYNTLTDFYSQAFYQQIHEWCQKHNVLFTGHLLYEEWLRRLVRVEGNLFKHYTHMDVVGVDHLYPIIGSRDRPEEHVAMKVGSSAAHQLGSPRLLCESFGGIFMDATMQRMKWIADWEYVLGVNLLNPHGFHYTLEGPRKRDWPPSQFYQYPWWPYYGEFSQYISRLSHMLSGGRHVAEVAVLWPINTMFATYTPQSHTTLGDRTEADFNTLTDLLLRLHYDFDYLDEATLERAAIADGTVWVRDEAYQLIILPPMAHIKLTTLEKLEQFVCGGGRLLGMIFLPTQAFADTGLVDINTRMAALFGIDPIDRLQNFRQALDIKSTEKEHPNGGKAHFLQSYALSRRLPMRLQQQVGLPGWPESQYFGIDESQATRYVFTPSEGAPTRARQDITQEVIDERQAVYAALQKSLNGLLDPDVVIDNPEVFYLHRVKDERDIYFLINPTFSPQTAQVTLNGSVQPVLWDPSTGSEQRIASITLMDGKTQFSLNFPPVGSSFILTEPVADSPSSETRATLANLEAPVILDGEWEFRAENANTLVIGKWQAVLEELGKGVNAYLDPDVVTTGWLTMVPGAWSYQLPSEPESDYPIPVWYRIRFQADYLPQKLELIVDGFGASEWKLYLNGQAALTHPVRSAIDSEMKAVDITNLVCPGENTIALRLLLTSATDGLLDLLKLMGEFSLERADDGSYRLAPPRTSLQAASWTEQGYPFFSGRGTYRRRFELPTDFHNRRIFLEPQMTDDVLEVLVNGQRAGVRLWPPYRMEITDFVRPGENVLELRVANTLVNLLEAVERPSGLAGAPLLVAYQR